MGYVYTSNCVIPIYDRLCRAVQNGISKHTGKVYISLWQSCSLVMFTELLDS